MGRPPPCECARRTRKSRSGHVGCEAAVVVAHADDVAARLAGLRLAIEQLDPRRQAAIARLLLRGYDVRGYKTTQPGGGAGGDDDERGIAELGAQIARLDREARAQLRPWIHAAFDDAGAPRPRR